MHAVADVLAELTELRVLPEVPNAPELGIDWSGLVSEWMSTEPEPETEPEEETVTEPVPEDYSYRSRGC